MPAHSHSTSLALDANSSTVPDAVEFLVASGVIAGWFLASALIVAWLTAVACLMTSLSTSVHAAAPLARMEATVSQSAFNSLLKNPRHGESVVIQFLSRIGGGWHAGHICRSGRAVFVHRTGSACAGEPSPEKDPGTCARCAGRADT